MSEIRKKFQGNTNKTWTYLFLHKCFPFVRHGKALWITKGSAIKGEVHFDPHEPEFGSPDSGNCREIRRNLIHREMAMLQESAGRVLLFRLTIWFQWISYHRSLFTFQAGEQGMTCMDQIVKATEIKKKVVSACLCLLLRTVVCCVSKFRC